MCKQRGGREQQTLATLCRVGSVEWMSTLEVCYRGDVAACLQLKMIPNFLSFSLACLSLLDPRYFRLPSFVIWAVSLVSAEAQTSCALVIILRAETQ